MSYSWKKRGGDIDGENQFDESGRSVSLSSDGSVVAIGSPFHDNNSGHVRVYKFDGNVWNKRGGDIYGDNDDQSGTSVSLSSDGSVVAIGAFRHDNYKGHVRVYKFDGNVWNKRGGDIYGDNDNDQSGTSVSLSSDGNVVAIGAPGPDNSGSDNSGHVRVYKFDGNVWNKRGGDIDGDNNDDQSGTSVSL